MINQFYKWGVYMHIFKNKRFIILISSLLLVAILYTVYHFVSINKKFPLDVNLKYFSQTLNEHKYKAANEYWDKTLKEYAGTPMEEKVAVKLDAIFNNFLFDFDVFIASDNFDMDIYMRSYYGIDAFGDKAKDKFAKLINKTLIRYANDNISYEKAEEVIKVLLPLTFNSVNEEQVYNELKHNRSIKEAYYASLSLIQNEEYIKALGMLLPLLNEIDSSRYDYYLIKSAFNDCSASIKLEANKHYAAKRYAEAKDLLESYLAIYPDDEASELLMRVYNMLDLAL